MLCLTLGVIFALVSVGLAGGVGLRAAISALDFHWANAHSGAPPPSVTMANHHHGSASASGPHKTGSSESLPPPPDSAIMGVSQSLMSGKALATVPLAQPPVSQPAAGTGVNDDMTEDKVWVGVSLAHGISCIIMSDWESAQGMCEYVLGAALRDH